MPPGGIGTRGKERDMTHRIISARHGRGLGLLLAVFCLIGLARPASAQVTFAERGTIVGVTQDYIRFLALRGDFKCPAAATLINLLGAAEASSGGTRDILIAQAIACCSQLSREINLATGQPFMSFGGLPDLANFQHNVVSQLLGRILCDLIDFTGGCLRAGFPFV